MNYKLSVHADRVSEKDCFILLKEGRVIAEKVSRFFGDSIKENVLQTLYQGFLACRGVLTHDDILVIEIQNRHVHSWLSGLVDYDEYGAYLDKVFDVLETLDCRYKFFFTDKPFAKQYAKKRNFTREKMSSVADLMSEFE